MDENQKYQVIAMNPFNHNECIILAMCYSEQEAKLILGIQIKTIQKTLPWYMRLLPAPIMRLALQKTLSIKRIEQ